MTDGKIEVLIKWQGLPDFENIWEAFDVIKQQFTDFHLEEKTILAGKGNDGSSNASAPIASEMKLYSRRCRSGQGELGAEKEKDQSN